MKRVRLIYEQLEEAGAYLRRGSLFHLRLALILTDNVGELLMFNALEDVFLREDRLLRPLRNTAEQIGMPVDPDLLPKYSPEERTRAEAEFEPMIRLLEHNLGRLPSRDARVLRIGHELRRDAFHKGQLREEILGPIVRLLFITVAGMTESFPLTQITVAPLDAEDKEFLCRFGIEFKGMFNYSEETRKQLSTKLLDGIKLDLESFKAALVDDLVGRVQSLISGLAGFYDSDAQNDQELFLYQCWKECTVQGKKANRKEMAEVFAKRKTTATPLVTTGWLRRFQASVPRKLNSSDSSHVLAAYWGLDKEFEPKEKFIDQHLADVDEAIQFQIDLARGK